MRTAKTVLLVCVFIANAVWASESTRVSEHANQILKNGNDIHVTKTGFLLDGGSHYAVLTDSAGVSTGVIILCKQRASEYGVVVAAYENGHLDTAGGQPEEANFKRALIDALKRAKDKNPNDEVLLGVLQSWFTKYGEAVEWKK